MSFAMAAKNRKRPRGLQWRSTKPVMTLIMMQMDEKT
jgi:hypothetical protein